MPVADFRSLAYGAGRVEASGRDVGRNVYWRLFAIENNLRVLINSVLQGQIGSSWWTVAVDPKIRKEAEEGRKRYAKRPWHGSPGKHDIYYTTLWQLNEIVRANGNLFIPVIPDIDQWIARIEQIRLPRNVVGHMNWLAVTDRKRVDIVHSDLRALIESLEASLPIVIP